MEITKGQQLTVVGNLLGLMIAYQTGKSGFWIYLLYFAVGGAIGAFIGMYLNNQPGNNLDPTTNQDGQDAQLYPGGGGGWYN